MKNLKTLAMKEFRAKYQSGDTALIEKRLLEELEYVEANSLETDVLVLYDLAKKLDLWNHRYYLGGTTANSFLLYILGISKTNPLATHYYCPVCGKIKFIRQKEFGPIREGFDLPDTDCDCGNTISGDGHSLEYHLIWRKRYENQIPMMLVVGNTSGINDQKIINAYRENGKEIYPDDIRDIEDDESENLEKYVKNIIIQYNPLCDKFVSHVPQRHGEHNKKLVEDFIENTFGTSIKNLIPRRVLNPLNISFKGIDDVDKVIRLMGILHGTWDNITIRNYEIDKKPKNERVLSLNLRRYGQSIDDIKQHKWPFPPIEKLPTFYDDFYNMTVKSEGVEKALNDADQAHYGKIIAKYREKNPLTRFIANQIGKADNIKEELRVPYLKNETEVAFKIAWINSIEYLFPRAHMLELFILCMNQL